MSFHALLSTVITQASLGQGCRVIDKIRLPRKEKVIIGDAGLITEVKGRHRSRSCNIRHKTVSTRGTFVRLSIRERDLSRNLH